jgi:hypothetical protein
VRKTVDKTRSSCLFDGIGTGKDNVDQINLNGGVGKERVCNE